MAIANPPLADTHKREAIVAATLAALVVLAHRRASGELTQAVWVLAVKRLLVDAHLTAAALARGSFAAIDHDTALLVGERLAEQFKYLDAFAAQAASRAVLGAATAAGEPTLFGAADVARLAQYAAAPIRGTFSAVLRQDAGKRGETEERNVLGASNSCDECPSLSAEGWVPIGTLPEIGARECRGNCACEIITR